ELNLVLEIALPKGQHAGKPLTLLAHSDSAFALPIGCAAKCADKVIFHRGAGKNMWAKNVNTAAAQRRCPLLDDSVRLLLVNDVGQGVTTERKVFRDRLGQVRTIG